MCWFIYSRYILPRSLHCGPQTSFSREDNSGDGGGEQSGDLSAEEPRGVFHREAVS